MASIIEKRIIPWDGNWGVALRYDNGTNIAYPVGGRDDAQRELLDPDPLPTRQAVLRWSLRVEHCVVVVDCANDP